MQYVSYGGYRSKMYKSMSAMPQSSNLRPILFNIFIIDLLISLGDKALAFVDVDKIYQIIKTLDDVWSKQAPIERQQLRISLPQEEKYHQPHLYTKGRTTIHREEFLKMTFLLGIMWNSLTKEERYAVRWWCRGCYVLPLIVRICLESWTSMFLVKALVILKPSMWWHTKQI